MCTIIIAHGVNADYPLVLAANRDEVYARGATGPTALSERPRVVGGLDASSRGTWMGVTEAGFFVGITNQRTYYPADRSLRSRGPIVRRALELGQVSAVRDMLGGLDPRAVNSFNLLYGDAGELEVAYVRREEGTLDVETVGRGVHVLPNDRIGSPEFPKAERARALVEPHAGEPWPILRERLRQALADHQLPADARVVRPPDDSPLTPAFVRKLHAMCVHTDDYGTRSATLAALVPGRVAHYEFAEGAPCTAAFVDRTALLTDASTPRVD